ncbi:acyl-CoA thioesterase [Zhihengliuella salsuginis]|uniref:Acyl-CoA thioester hydrolase n=1 Tax=Zhihengliuella salsuginis TaxID=578222 RepID=A0ABQ3GBJ9_9MICC|nr:acyl-CoA thioesterase [Zhihengliuella salsuginis]GHD00449.1 hypothetical protein GCM10008096_03770 [Zhihengliuella salsuginis]
MAFTDVPLALRWSDQDANGHLNNARIVTLMEESRVRWMRRLSGLDTFRGGGGAVVASLTVDYLAQGEYVPEMVVRVGVERIGAKSFTIRHVGVQGGTTVFDGSTVVVPLAEDRVTARELTATERGTLSEHEVEPRERRG